MLQVVFKSNGILALIMTLSEELSWRGFVNQTTYKDVTVLDGEPIIFYWGVDPSADSMQIGNLAAAMLVKCFMKHGHQAVLLIGGATGMIGDPDGRSAERDLLSLDELTSNKKAITGQYRRIFAGQPFTVVDNFDWFKDMRYLEFLRDVGKHVPMRQMLARDFVQSRLSEEGSGISYAEFSYVLIQAYDFLHLYRHHNVTLQLAGSDQWGNSIAGVELIRRVADGEAHVWTAPLVVNKATGRKFGKTEAGAIWLDAGKTAPFDFYQFWLNADDEGVADYIKIYTELDKPAVDDLLERFQADRAGRIAQKTLAREATALVHGTATAENMEAVSHLVVSDSRPTDEEFRIIKENLRLHAIQLDWSMAEILVAVGLAASRTEARQFLDSGAIYVNNQRADKSLASIRPDDVRQGVVLLRRGKNTVAVGQII